MTEAHSKAAGTGTLPYGCLDESGRVAASPSFDGRTKKGRP